MKFRNDNMKNLRILLLIICMSLSLGDIAAQQPRRGNHGEHKPDKTEWLRKMKAFKHDFLARELDLAPKQRDEFFKLYDAKEEARFNAEKQVRKMERQILKKGENATDEECDCCIKAQYELNEKLAEIEKKYESAMRKILSKRQLVRLPHAERKFQRRLMEGRKDCPHPPKP